MKQYSPWDFIEHFHYSLFYFHIYKHKFEITFLYLETEAGNVDLRSCQARLDFILQMMMRRHLKRELKGL